MNYFCPRPEFLLQARAQNTQRSRRSKTENWDMKSSQGDQHAASASASVPNSSHYRRFKSEGDCPDSSHGDHQSANTSAEDQRKYDFYLAVPDEDLENFGIPFCEMVESRMNMKACMSIHVDIGMKYENMARTVETECGGKVVFVVSENFPDSDECQFLVHFAKTLDPAAKMAKLIPLEIDKEVPLPQVLKGLTSIRYNAAFRQNWLGDLLWIAVKGGQRPLRLRSSSSSVP